MSGGIIAGLILGVSLARSVAEAADVAPGPSAPAIIARGPDGSLFIADLTRPGVARRDVKGRLDVFAIGSPRHRTPLHAVTALAVGRDGTLFAADRATGEVYRVEAGKPPAPLSGGAFEVPTGLAVTPEGDLIVCDLRLGIVARLPVTGGPPTTLARVPAPRGLTLAPGGEIVVLSMGPDQFVRVAAGGDIRPIVKGQPFRLPLAVIRDDTHQRWLVSDGYARTVWEVSEAGEARPWLKGTPLVRPEGLALDADGAVLVADPSAGRIFRAPTPDAVHPWHPAP